MQPRGNSGSIGSGFEDSALDPWTPAAVPATIGAFDRTPRCRSTHRCRSDPAPSVGPAPVVPAAGPAPSSFC